jgi:hypothetical protein
MAMLKFLCLLFVSAVFADRATYHNYQVRRVVPANEEQLKVLRELENEPNGVSWLNCYQTKITRTNFKTTYSKEMSIRIH